MRLGIDATPLLGQRSGVGRYVQGLLEGLAQQAQAPQVLLATFSLRGRPPEGLPGSVAPGRLRLPARLLHLVWDRAGWPPAELLTGRLDVFHATNFVLPPVRRAGAVVTVHDLTYLRYPQTVTSFVATYARRVPDAIRRADIVITVSRAVAAELTDEYGISGDRLLVAPNGVDDRLFAARPAGPSELTRMGLPERFLLFVGNREPRKNLGMLVAAHACARREDEAVPRLVLVGPAGWGDPWSGDVPDPAHVTLAGYRSDDDLRHILAAATAVVAPSVYEGFGLPLVEAMATGVPVVASRIPAHEEVAAGHAVLVDPRDRDAWSEAIVRTCSAQPDAEARRSAREHARQFTWRRSAALHLEAYGRSV